MVRGRNIYRTHVRAYTFLRLKRATDFVGGGSWDWVGHIVEARTGFDVRKMGSGRYEVEVDRNESVNWICGISCNVLRDVKRRIIRCS